MANRKYSGEYIIGILKEAAAGAKTSELCRKYGMQAQTFYRWREKYAGMTVPDLERLQRLEEENLKLKKKVAELTLDVDTAKELLRKNF